uniref:Disintegrin and metalloproteinase domain-containing protein 28 n=1 Tax=Syphacia muris TaxID=451379 RepID=A0A0N5A8L8_9BILA
MSVYRPHCKINIRSNGRVLNVFRLIEMTRLSDEFSLQFDNTDGESQTINFSLTKHSQTVTMRALTMMHTVHCPRVVCRNLEFTTKQKRDTKATRANYYGKYLDGKWRYVEFAFVGDRSLFDKYNKNATAVHERMETIANHMNALYQPINIRIALVWVDIWSGTDPITVQANSDLTLRDFLTFRKSFNNVHHNDNAHLLTNVKFDDNVVGKGYKGTMCSFDHSGGVNMDHHAHAAFVAATVAHEMGHNFGMDHDTVDDCQCESETGCIMAAAASGYTPPTFWSECSLRFLYKSFSHGLGDGCLFDQPKELFGGARCGNSIVEEGEECDCGSTVSCSNNCCDAKTCKLVEGAECATGDCCDLTICKIQPASTVCRVPADSCDLPEYCDGHVEHCPADFYVQDGLPCPDGSGDFCYDGRCGNRDAQCKKIWGNTGKNADEACYNLNTAGNSGGNCGYDSDKKLFLPCEKKNFMCGRLQCDHANEKHELPGEYSLQQTYTTIRSWNQPDVVCRVVFTRYKKTKDPGMVMNGAICGDDMMCVNSKCKNRTEELKFISRCVPENCHGAGICNNMGNCHCKPGYGGVDCAVPGHGGSVNSGPSSGHGPFNVGMLVFWLLLALFVIFCIASYFVKRRKNVWLHKIIWKRIKVTFNIRRMVVPIRKAPPPPPAPITNADLNAMWGDQPDRLAARKANGHLVAQYIIPSGSFEPNVDNSNSDPQSSFVLMMSSLQASQKSEKNNNSSNALVSSVEPHKYDTVSNITRPTLPPPVPPSSKVPPVPPHKPTLTAARQKPPLPKKPLVASKLKVKDIAARFNSEGADL